MSVVVAKRYAKSVFDLAKEKNTLDKTHEELNVFLKIFKRDVSILNFFINPVLSQTKKKEIFEKMFGENCNDFTKSILFFIIKNKRTKLLIEILEEFNKFFYKDKNIMQIELTTAKKISQDFKDSIVAKIGKEKKVLLKEKVDKSLLGGVLLKVEDKQFDSTVRNSINKVKNSFKI